MEQRPGRGAGQLSADCLLRGGCGRAVMAGPPWHTLAEMSPTKDPWEHHVAHSRRECCLLPGGQGHAQGPLWVPAATVHPCRAAGHSMSFPSKLLACPESCCPSCLPNTSPTW